MPIISANISDTNPDETPTTKIIKLSKLVGSKSLLITIKREIIPTNTRASPGKYFINFKSLAAKFTIKVMTIPINIAPRVRSM